MDAYAVVKSGGKQYTVQAGDVLKVEVMPGKAEGDSVELDTLAAKHGDALNIGQPELSEKVTATILREGRAKKILVFKRRRRTTYRKKNGHRQSFHEIRIDSIPG